MAGAAEKAKASSLSDGTREIEIRNVSSEASDGSEQAMTAILQSKLNATLN